MSITIKRNIKPSFEVIGMLCDKPLSKDTAQQIIRTERFVDKVHAYERAFQQHVPVTD